MKHDGPLRVYIAGPMTGLPALNFPSFKRNADRLRMAGFRVSSPHELHIPQDMPWADCMCHAIKMMMDCEIIFMLNGWSSSKGANIEFELAKQLGFGVIYEDDLFPDFSSADLSPPSTQAMKAHNV